MANKQDVQEMMVAMGFRPDYVQGAFKVHEVNDRSFASLSCGNIVNPQKVSISTVHGFSQEKYGTNYDVEVMTDIIISLQEEDKKSEEIDNEQQSSALQLNVAPKPPNKMDIDGMHVYGAGNFPMNRYALFLLAALCVHYVMNNVHTAKPP